jgi:hypothetical protein
MSPPAPCASSPRPPLDGVSRRDLLLFGAGGLFSRSATAPLKPIVISVNVMLDRGAHSVRGLTESEIAKFKQYQESARREYATSGILFDLRYVEGAFLRTQGYSEIPEKFLARKTINLFVTDTLGYDIDRDRTGGCSTGPRPRGPRSAPDPFYKTFLGLRDARDTTLAHEYAHHFTLDTRRNPTMTGNLWADLRNDLLLWRQRHGVPILQFRACSNSEWARVEAG